MLYPIKFEPIFKEKIWGGTKLHALLGKDCGHILKCGESWEISGVKEHVSVVANGVLKGQNLSQLIQKYQEKLLGNRVFERFGSGFPLLIKFLDAAQNLSIQVHPDDKLAQKRHQGFGKTEMWYVMQADPEAQLISGFNRPINRQIYLDFFEKGKLEELLNVENVEAENVFFIPAGRVHTIGKGILLAEIQQTSDITYRIYDYDRVDTNGNKRELHVQEALDAIDYTHHQNYKHSYHTNTNLTSKLIKCDYFTCNLLYFDQTLKRNYQTLGSFVIYMCVQGSCLIKHVENTTSLGMGESVLLPAALTKFDLEPQTIDCKLLEIYV